MAKRFLCLFILFFTITSSTYAECNPREGFTPYGAKVPVCGTYGYCKKPLTYKQAVHNLELYYAQKGLKVVVTRWFGRFLEAKVYKNKKIVEKVILDRKTGRIRPTY